MLISLLLIVGGLALLYFGAEGLVRGSAALALRLGLTPLVVGLTVVAFGTSSPELVVSLGAALGGSSDIALGNVIGSNISNVALILGLTVLVRPAPVQAQLLRLDVPVMIGCSALLFVLLLDGGIDRLEGAVLALGAVGYTAFNLWYARRKPDVVGRMLGEEPAEALPQPRGSAWRDVAFVLVGLGLLVVGARLLVEGAVAVAERFGLSEAFIGLTIVAIGTSLPELATSIVAALKGEGDLAIGNVVGSNVFNILGILGFSSLVHPLQGSGIGPVDLGVMLVLAVGVLVLMRSGYRLVRWEGALLLLGYAGYIYYLVP